MHKRLTENQLWVKIQLKKNEKRRCECLDIKKVIWNENEVIIIKMGKVLEEL